MPIEIRLKALLHQYGLDSPGVSQQIAKDLHVHRHSIGKLYRNQLKNPSLELVDQVCGWLMKKGVPANRLPQQLFGFRAMKFWEAIAASKQVTFYLGEYIQETGSPGHVQRWISRWDANAVNGIIEHLTVMESAQKSRPQLRTRYAAFRAGIAKKDTSRAAELEQDKQSSKELFARMRSESSHETPIIIGSQRVNYLLEHFVADLFGCKPFSTASIGAVPFYLRYRASDRALSSCFGGREGPPHHEEPGVYYLAGKGPKWVQCPWEPRKQDAGVVIVHRDPGTDGLEIALFGLSGWATVVIGRQLDGNANFWPPMAQRKGREVGVYICRITFKELEESADLAVPEAESFEVIPIEESILEARFK